MNILKAFVVTLVLIVVITGTCVVVKTVADDFAGAAQDLFDMSYTVDGVDLLD